MNLFNVNRMLAVAIVMGITPFAGIKATQAQVPATQQQLPQITQISVAGNERVEAETIVSYLTVRAGDSFDPARLDESLKNLFATGLFADVKFSASGTALIIRVVENPIINRVIFEGNKKLDNDDLREEVRIRPRMVFTRAKIRSDVQRMLELYRRKGRFAAIIEPKVVQQDQNRADVVFEIQEGPKTKVSQINFLGNRKFSDSELRDVMATQQSRWWKIFTSNDTFDPDRMAYDQQQVRTFYLDEGYADFRVVSAVAELTPDREDFFMTFTVEEGEIYDFGEVSVESEIRDVDASLFKRFLLMEKGDRYSATKIEDTIEALTNAAGLLGYAFVDIRPQIDRDKDARTMSVNFRVLEAPRVYVERINIKGNVRTLDRVIRREFRLQEGNAFNSALVTRSENRLERLNFFRESEVERVQGSKPDRMVLEVSVEEQATGELNVGAGFSSIENFIFDFSIRERNLMGRGHDLRLGTRLSRFRKEIDVGFTEPYFMGRNVAAGIDLFARRVDSSLYGSGFNVDSFGGSLRAGVSLGEYWTLQSRYTLSMNNTYFADSTINRILISQYGYQPDIEPLLVYPNYYFDNFERNESENLDIDGDDAASRNEKTDYYLNNAFTNDLYKQSVGKRLQSIIGYTIGFDTRNSYIRPTAGRAFYITQDFAGVGGDVSYLRSRVNFDNYWTPFEGWTLRLSAEAGVIKGFGEFDEVLLNDRFFLGGPKLRGFYNSGVGPTDFLTFSRNNERGISSNFGGTKQYIGRTELFFPLGDAALEMGVNASAFIDAGALWGAGTHLEQCGFGLPEWDAYRVSVAEAQAGGNQIPSFGFETNCIAGDTYKPRIAAGIGFSWQSPFGPFRIDLTKPIKTRLGDRTQTLQFNIGTVF